MALRLFRADTPHDIVCASFVAARLPPGKDILLYSTDKVLGDARGMREAMQGTAGLHRWATIVDISGLPLREFLFGSRRPGARVAMARAVGETVAALAARIAPALGIASSDAGVRTRLNAAVDELYLTCYHHPDVQAMYAMFPRALKAYFPHGFDSVHRAELEAHGRYFSRPRGARRRVREALFDIAKRVALGSESLLPRVMRIDRAYSFNLALPWAGEQVDLSDALCRRSMEELYERLPPPVRTYFGRVASEVGGRALLAILPPFDWPTEELNVLQRRGMAELAVAACRKEAASLVLVKPHPRNSPEDVAGQVRMILDSAPGIPLIVLEEHGPYPVELVMAPFKVTSCASLGSSSCRPLRMIYGMRSYISEPTLRALYSSDPGLDVAMGAWLEGNRGSNVCL